jgi:hypothetical protein
MKIGIMQPYLFPYIGYFQLINVCDIFVIHDDVQYIKGGWINRNRILMNGEAKQIALPVEKSSTNVRINEKLFAKDFSENKEKFLRKIEGAYNKAPFYDDVRNIIVDIFSFDERNVSRFVSRSLEITCRYIEVDTEFRLSSQLDKNDSLKGQERVIEINKVLGSSHYINMIGGLDLYDKNAFNQKEIALSFLKSRETIYRQHGGVHLPFLSIIDVLMFNTRDNIKDMLGKFDLLQDDGKNYEK